MKPPPCTALLTVGLLTAVFVVPVSAAVVDGHLDPEYGLALSTQANQTSLGDTYPGDPPPEGVTYGFGSELDEAFGFVADGTLHLFFSGNLQSYFGEPLIQPDGIEVFIDTTPGGQSPLRSDNPATGYYLTLSALAGLTFDAGFTPDYWFDLSVAATGPGAIFVFGADLPAAGGGVGQLIGRASGGDGTLTGGTNPHGIQATINQANRAGVTAGCGPASGEGVTTGIEWAIPLAAIGNPAGPIKVCAILARPYGGISNQVLGTLPSGTCALGPPGSVNFESHAGSQYFTIDLATPARRASWGQLRSHYR